MQPDELAQVGKADAVTVPGNFFQNAKGAAKRLNAGALLVFGVIVDIGARVFHQPGGRQLAGLFRLVGL